jgi:hypothetical protein
LMKHRQYVHQVIQALREDLEREQKKDFLEPNN